MHRDGLRFAVYCAPLFAAALTAVRATVSSTASAITSHAIAARSCISRRLLSFVEAAAAR